MIGLVDHELVAHVFVTSGRPEDWDELRSLWTSCVQQLALDDQIPWTPGIPVDLPTAAARNGAVTGVVAGRRAAGADRSAMILRHGAAGSLVLSVQLAPDPADPRTWEQLDDRWEGVLPVSTPWPVGSARLLVARVSDPQAAADVDQWESTVRADLPTDVRLRGTGELRTATSLGPFAVWETTIGREPDDLRRHRRLVVVAAHDREHQLSAWTWRSRMAEPAPLTRYLATAAQCRHVMRDEPRTDVAALLTRADAAMTPLRELIDGTAAGREPDAAALASHLGELQVFQAGTVTLVGRASTVRDTQRRISIAWRNLVALAADHPDDRSDGAGPFADDRRFAETTVSQYEHDGSFLETAALRARDVATVTDQMLQRGLQRRRERVNVLLTGIVGALLMGLAAIQAFDYDIPLPPVIDGPVVAVLTAVALLAPLVVVRLAGPHRKLTSDVGVGAGTGMLVGTATWVGVSLSGDALWPWAIAAGAAASGATVLMLRRRSR